MPLDPIVKMICDQANASEAPPVHSLSPVDARTSYEALRPTTTQELARVEDITIAGAQGPLRARLYAPRDDASLPVVLYLHGGGWVIGSIETHDSLCQLLAKSSGCCVISLDYRLAPEHKFPAAPEDVYAALVDLQARAAELGVDGSRLAVAGDSAGGNLSAAVAIMCRDRGGPALAMQGLIYPVTNYSFDTNSYRDNAEGYLLTTETMRWFWDHYLSDAADGANPLASPLKAADVSGVAPAYIITAEYDPLRDEGDAYAAKLAAAGVAVTHRPYDGMVHEFVRFNDFIPQGKQAVVDLGAALRKAFEPA